MPIKDVSNARRIPRLGKIKLGIKVQGQGQYSYPKATDYFVVPDEVKTVFGDKPKKLKIMFPSDDPEEIAPQYLRCYGITHGLVCWGTGYQAHRKIDKVTGELAGRNTTDWQWQEIDCVTQDCPEYGTRCRPIMNLIFAIIGVPGLGIWQIDTSSFYSIRNINSCLALIQKATGGRLAFIPLNLSLMPQDVFPPGVKKKNVYILNLQTELMLEKLIEASKEKPEIAIAMSGMSIPELDINERPEDLFPTALIETSEQGFTEDPDIFSRKLGEWNQIKKLVKRRKYSIETINSYFQAHGLYIQPGIMEKEGSTTELADTPPKTISLDLLIEFKEYLTGNMKLG